MKVFECERRSPLFLCGTDAELSTAQAYLVTGAAGERPTSSSPVEGEQVELERQLSDAAEELKRLVCRYLSCLTCKSFRGTVIICTVLYYGIMLLETNQLGGGTYVRRSVCVTMDTATSLPSWSTVNS